MWKKIYYFCFVLLFSLFTYCNSGSSGNDNNSESSSHNNSSSGGSSSGGTMTPDTNNRLLYAYDKVFTNCELMYIVTADFNNDKKPDIAGTEGGGKSVTVLINNEGTGFDVSYISIANIGDLPYRLEPADFNNDGNTDLAIIKKQKNSVCVLLGNGDGSFQSPKDYPAGLSPTCIVIYDMNNDSNPDILTGTVGSTVNILYGNGNGTFQSPASVNINSTTNSIAAGNLNNDGFTDMIVTEGDGVRIYFGQGSNSFIKSTYYATGESPTCLKISDLNKDSVNDLVLVNHETSSISVFLGNGDGTLAARSDYCSSDGPMLDIKVCDINNDTIDDIVYLGGYKYMGVLIGNGDGSFVSDTWEFSIGSFSQTIAVADINGDSVMDIVAEDVSGKSITIASGQGNCFFNAPILLHTSGEEPKYLQSADLNGDGNQDLVVTNKISEKVDIFLGKGNGMFTAPVSYRCDRKPVEISIADINNDTSPDLAILNSESDRLTLLFNNGDGTFGNKQNITVPLYCVDIQAGDFNNDKNIDFCMLRTGSCVLMIGDGSGNFTKTPGFGSFSSSRSLEVGYINNDSNLDILVGTRSQLYIMLGNGDGSFQSQQKIYTTDSTIGILDIITGDFNADLTNDIAVPVENNESVQVLLCNDDASVKASINFSTEKNPQYIATADITGDGILDLVLDSHESNYITVLPGDGSGFFGEADSYNISGIVKKLITNDFNNDGKNDVALVDGGHVQILLHQ